MSVRFRTGDMFTSDAQAIVNTVNCVGVMGKGVALEFKRRWPDNFKAYKKACDNGTLRPGTLLIFERTNLFEAASPRYLVNFPTKDHWRAKSKIEYIRSGLDALAGEISKLGIQSIALPPLGCGNGGLDWEVVRPLIVEKLRPHAHVDIQVYAPSGKGDEPEFVDVAAKMTAARAVYVKAIASIEPRFGGSVDRLSLQKIAYFLQEFGAELNLEFSDSLYGPYSEKLKKALVTFNKWRFINGLDSGDRQAHVTPAGFAAADDFLRRTSRGEEMVDRLLHLVDGYNTPYGLELLATIHFHLKPTGPSMAPSVLFERLSESNPHRRNSFTQAEIFAAYTRLTDDHLLAPKDAS